MEPTLRQEAEKRLGSEIHSDEWDEAKAYAEHKLETIIAREGDADGVRREPWYLAELIAETVYARRFSAITIMHYQLIQEDNEGIKKGRHTPESVRHPHQHPHCITDTARMQ